MGLDMYMTARSSRNAVNKEDAERYDSPYYIPAELASEVTALLNVHPLGQHQHDSFTRLRITVEQPVAYWRKHPNLHGFIVSEFADGVDECQEILLTGSRLTTLREAIVNDELEETTGFFFGRSPDPESEDPEEREWAQQRKEEDLAIITSCLALDAEGYEIVYQASW